MGIRSKRLNDEQTSCHRVLQSVETREEYDIVTQYACRHPVKCFAVVYNGVCAPVVRWSNG
jgi:hypothetical protein